MATYALAGTPSASGARPVASIAVPGPRPRPVTGPLPAERVLPVLPELAGLFPGGGLPRGGTVLLGPASVPDTLLGSRGTPGPGPAMASRRPGLTSLLLLLLAGTSSLGHWCAVTGLPELGLVAAAELGADLDHLVIIPNPGCEGRWQSVVATLLETVDLVCLAPDTPVRPVDARRLAARAREHCSTLLVLDACTPTGVARGFLSGGPARPGRAMARWPGPSDLRCAVRESNWSGLERGHGLLSSRQLEAEVCGRGAASRPRRGLLRLPA
ncbi:MAG: hypothetical protein ABSF89_04850 [Acidimicrobiales bacterium]